ncbi:heat shock protein GrpE [Nitzschia inconspicua]|uniref:Heat shock protein GrpE n=1 Tax=Nitzschia inconspicua TaxID=303405 RepID=A0A9K3L9X4_9STRA|nr:heat shock protein GrpE [Nitzschia inconspicua]
MMFPNSILLIAIAAVYQSTTFPGADAFSVVKRIPPFKQQQQVSNNPLSIAIAVVPSSSSTTCLGMTDNDGGSSESNTEQEAAQDTTPAGDDTGTSSSSSSTTTSGADDILNSPAFLKRKLEVLQSDLEKTETALDEALERAEIAKEEWGPQLEKLQMEYENIRIRMSDQNEKGDAQAIVKVVQEVLSLLDNFDRAYGVIKPETDAERAIEAEYKAAYQSILDTFAKLGVTEVETVGKEFDYELHQAVMQMPGTEYEEGICCQEFQKGFIMEETLIRPAMVAVAA